MEPLAIFQVMQLGLRLLIYTFIGKAVLAILLGSSHRENPVWRLFDTITRPVWRLTRRLAPRAIGDAAITWIAIGLLILVNLALYMWFYSRGWLTS